MGGTGGVARFRKEGGGFSDDKNDSNKRRSDFFRELPGRRVPAPTSQQKGREVGPPAPQIRLWWKDAQDREERKFIVTTRVKRKKKENTLAFG